MILDTCFLIDLQREVQKGMAGRATVFLREHSNAPFSISVISVTEFSEGFAQPSAGERFLRAYARVDVNSTIASWAARIRRNLRIEGNLIGDFDILIAATALSESIPLVTRNIAEFSRVKGIELIAY
jgi:tRNA(fMet)-specific endonuclease VapC